MDRGQRGDGTGGLMSAALLRLAEGVDAVLPQLLLFVLGRRLVVSCVNVLSLLVKIGTPSRLTWTPSHRTKAMLRFGSASLQHSKTAIASCMTMFCLRDLYTNWSDLGCEPHSVPRPVGIAAAIALLALVTTYRLSTSVSSIVVLLVVKDRGVLSSLAALVALCDWTHPNSSFHNWLRAIATVAAGRHALVCTSSSSAALSVNCACGLVASLVLALYARVLRLVRVMLLPRSKLK